MPKFVKGSQEAKDYMAGLRAKRMSGGKIPQPPRNKVDTGKVPPPEDWEQTAENAPVRIRPPPIRIRPPPIRRITNTNAPNPFEGNGLVTDIVGTIKKTAKKTRKIIKKTAQSVKTIAQGGRDDYPPSVRRLLAANGNKKIVSAIINRKPVDKKLSGLLNVLSLGQFKKNIDSEPYDDLFHLSISLRTEDGTNILTEKIEVINLAKKTRKGGENLPVTPFAGGKTLNEIMENTKKRMGDKFFGYSARNNNCQDFIMALLQSNGMGDTNDFSFVKQDAKQMFKGLKTLSKVADFITDLGGATNVLIKGTGAAASVPAPVPVSAPVVPVEEDEEDEYGGDSQRDTIIDMEEDIVANIKDSVYRMVANLIREVGDDNIRKHITDDEMVDIVWGIVNEEIKIVWDFLQSGDAPADFDFSRIPFYSGKKWKDFRKKIGTIQRKVSKERRMFGRGAAASVPAPVPVPAPLPVAAPIPVAVPAPPILGADWSDTEITDNERYLDNYEFTPNIERAFIEEMMKKFNMSKVVTVRGVKNLPFIPSPERQIEDGSLLDVFVWEQLKFNDVDWGDYASGGTLKKERPPFVGEVYNTAVLYFTLTKGMRKKTHWRL